MRSLRSGQLFALLVLLRIFALFCTTVPFSAAGIGGALLSSALQAVLLLAVCALYDNGFAATRDMRPPWLLAVYGLFFLCWGARLLLRLWEVASGITFPVQNKLLGALLLALVCLYASYLGLKSIARGATIVFALLLVCLAILLLGAYAQFSPENLLPAGRGVLAAFWQDLCDSGGIVSAFFLCGFVKEHRRRAVLGAVAASFSILLLLSLLGMGVLGRLVEVADYPFFTLGAFSQPFSTQRADAIYVVVFTLLGTVSIALQIRLAAYALTELCPRCPYKNAVVTVLLLVLAFCMHRFLRMAWLGAIGIALLLGVVPCLLWCLRRCTGEAKKEVRS